MQNFFFTRLLYCSAIFQSPSIIAQPNDVSNRVKQNIPLKSSYESRHSFRRKISRILKVSCDPASATGKVFYLVPNILLFYLCKIRDLREAGRFPILQTLQ
jgi:hypothetical protein